MPSISFVGEDGKPLTSINRETPFRINLDTGRADGPDTIDVTFSWDDGDESDSFTITKMADGTYSSTVVTAERGGTGGGTISFMGLATSTGDAGPLRVEQDEYLTVSWGITSSRVKVFNTWVQEGLYINRMFLSQVAGYYSTLAMNTQAVIRAFEALGEDNLNEEGKRLLELAREAHTIANTGISITGRAFRYLNNSDRMLDTQRYFISSWYVNRLKGDFDPAVTSNPNYRHSLRNYRQQGEMMGTGEFDGIRMASERGRRHAEDVMWRQLGQALIGAYRLLANATGAAQVMTLFGTNEMGEKAKDWERLVAFFDLLGQAALMGAMMRFQVTHTVRNTQPRLQRSPAAIDPETAPTGARIDPTSAGITDAGAAQAQLIARKHGVHILTRQSGQGVAELRTQGFSPKPMDIKAKTINELDVHLGAPASGLKQVGFFEPKMPGSRPAGMDDATWGQLRARHDQRLAEYNGPTGQKMRKLQDDGLIEIRDGVAYDTGLVSGSGKPITGDYDLFEIVFPDGTPVPKHVYDAVVADLTAGPFQAMHGAHMRWDIQLGDYTTFADFVHAADVIDTNLGIYNKIVRSHHDEPLVVFGGDRPPYALTSDATPPIKLADVTPAPLPPPGTTMTPLMNPTTALRYGNLAFLDPVEASQLQLADDNWNRSIASAFPPMSDLEGPLTADGGLLDVEPAAAGTGATGGLLWTKIAAAVAAIAVFAGGAWWLTRDDSTETAEPAVVEPADEGADSLDGSDGAGIETDAATEQDDTAADDASTGVDDEATGAGDATDEPIDEVELADDAPVTCGTFPDDVAPFIPGSYGPLEDLPPCDAPPTSGYSDCDVAIMPCSPTNSLPLFQATSVVGVTHSGSAPDAITGQSGPSQASHGVRELTGLDGWWNDGELLVVSDCGGTSVAGRAPFDDAAGAAHPLFQYGPCRVTSASIEGPAGETFPLAPEMFAAGGEFEVDANEVDMGFVEPVGVVTLDDRFTVRDWAAASVTVLNVFGADVIPDQCLIFAKPGLGYFSALFVNGCEPGGWIFTVGQSEAVDFPSGWTPLAHGAGYVNPAGDRAGSSGDFAGQPTSGPLFDQSVFPCGLGHVGATICPPDAPPVEAGSFVVVSTAFADVLPLAAADTASSLSIDFEVVDGDRFTIDLADWTVSRSSGPTRTRAIVRDNSLTVAIPHDELPDGQLFYTLETEVDDQTLVQPIADVGGFVITPEVAEEVSNAPSTSGPTDDTPDGSETVETVEAFYGQFVEAVRNGDTDILLARLHPTVLDAYPDSCPDVLSSFADLGFDVNVIGAGEPVPWTWELPDGRSFEIPDATTVTIALSGRGQNGEPTESHLAAVDGQWRWFTYC